MAIVRTAKGTASDKTGALTLTVATVQIPKDTSMIVGVGYDAGSGDPSMTWGTRVYDAPRERLQDLGMRIAYFSLWNNGATETNDVVLTWTTTAPTSKEMFVTQISETRHRDVFEANSGTDGSPTSNGDASNLPTNFAEEYLCGIFVSEGPTTDTAGVPGASFISGQRDGTTGGAVSTNTTIHETYKITGEASANAVASKTGATSRDWLAMIVSLKPIYTVSVDARFEITDVTATSQAEADAFVEGDIESRCSPPYTVTILP